MISPPPTSTFNIHADVLICFVAAESSYEAQSRLEAILLKNYSREIRPVLDYDDNVTVMVGISLSRIQEMVRHPRTCM